MSLRLPCSLRRVLRLLPLVAAAALSPALAAAQEGVLRPGDVLHIVVYRQPDLSGEVEVGADGTLVHPLYRDLRVTGLSRAELQERMAAHLARYGAEPVFVADPLVRVTVSGEVRQPQVATVRPGTTVLQAVASTGGVSPTGNGRRVQLVRDGVSRRLDLTNPSSPGFSESVRSGDLIVVDRRSTWVRDIVTPTASVLGVVVAVVNLLRTRSSR